MLIILVLNVSMPLQFICMVIVRLRFRPTVITLVRVLMLCHCIVRRGLAIMAVLLCRRVSYDVLTGMPTTTITGHGPRRDSV